MKIFHRQLKTVLLVTPDPQRWTKFLPIVLHACRSVVKTDLVFSSAELLYGQFLPGQMLTPVDWLYLDLTPYVTILCFYCSDLPPIIPRTNLYLLLFHQTSLRGNMFYILFLQGTAYITL